MKIILYGAGQRGIKIAEVLQENNIEIDGFCDSNKTGSVSVNGAEGSKRIKIFPLDGIDGSQYVFVVTIADCTQRMEVRNMLQNRGIRVLTVEDILCNHTDVVKKNREIIADYHQNRMDSYFDAAESIEGIQAFWSPESPFMGYFKKLNIEKVVELACGKGRHVPQYIDGAKEITLVDILEKNIDFCKQRFQGYDKILYYVNNGYDLSGIESESQTALFTYDAMVHFEMMDVFQYLKETYRILSVGGKALFHHSNNTEDYRITFLTGTGGRNYMSKQLFAYLANRAGLTVLEQRVIDWGKKDLDCITLVEKQQTQVEEVGG